MRKCLAAAILLVACGSSSGGNGGNGNLDPNVAGTWTGAATISLTGLGTYRAGCRAVRHNGQREHPDRSGLHRGNRHRHGLRDFGGMVRVAELSSAVFHRDVELPLGGVHLHACDGNREQRDVDDHCHRDRDRMQRDLPGDRNVRWNQVEAPPRAASSRAPEQSTGALANGTTADTSPRAPSGCSLRHPRRPLSEYLTSRWALRGLNARPPPFQGGAASETPGTRKAGARVRERRRVPPDLKRTLGSERPPRDCRKAVKSLGPRIGLRIAVPPPRTEEEELRAHEDRRQSACFPDHRRLRRNSACRSGATTTSRLPPTV